MKRTVVAALVALSLSAVFAAASMEAQDTPAKPSEAWKPFQEFGFLSGSWSGTAENGPRVGGRVSRWTAEMGGNYLVQRGTTVFPAQAGATEDSTEDVGYIAYDRERRKYVAWYFFSTGVSGTFDVDLPSPGIVRMVSTSLENYDVGAKMRLTITRKSDAELAYQLELAPQGKEFVGLLTSKLAKK